MDNTSIDSYLLADLAIIDAAKQDMIAALNERNIETPTDIYLEEIPDQINKIQDMETSSIQVTENNRTYTPDPGAPPFSSVSVSIDGLPVAIEKTFTKNGTYDAVPTENYILTTDQSPQEGVVYYTKDENGNYIQYAGDSFEEGVDYYILEYVDTYWNPVITNVYPFIQIASYIKDSVEIADEFILDNNIISKDSIEIADEYMLSSMDIITGNFQNE